MWRLCGVYLLEETRLRPHIAVASQALDPVAHFHLGNGAQLAGMSWAGDLSEAGLKRSYGMMAHYCYSDFDALDGRAADYASAGATPAVAAAGAVP